MWAQQMKQGHRSKVQVPAASAAECCDQQQHVKVMLGSQNDRPCTKLLGRSHSKLLQVVLLTLNRVSQFAMLVILRDITACVKNLLKAEAVGSQNIMHAYHWSCVKEHQANWTVFPISQHALSSSSHVKIQSIPFFSQF